MVVDDGGSETVVSRELLCSLDAIAVCEQVRWNRAEESVARGPSGETEPSSGPPKCSLPAARRKRVSAVFLLVLLLRVLLPSGHRERSRSRTRSRSWLCARFAGGGGLCLRGARNRSPPSARVAVIACGAFQHGSPTQRTTLAVSKSEYTSPPYPRQGRGNLLVC